MMSREIPQAKINVLSLLSQVRKNPITLLSSLHQEYGDIFTITTRSINIIAFSNPEYVKHILLDNSQNYAARMGITPVIQGKVVTESKSINDKPKGIELHEFTGHLLTKTAAERLTPDIIILTKNKVDQWNENPNPNFILDIYKEFVYLSVEIVGLTLFGVDIKNETELLADAAKQLLRLVHKRYLSVIKFPLWIPTPANRKQKRLAKQLFDTFDLVLEKSINEGRDGNIVKTWLKLQKEHHEYRHLGDYERQQDLMSFFVPSFETTPFVVTSTLYHLARFPKIQQEIQQEIDDIFGQKEPDYEKFSKLGKLRCFVYEVMRYYPPLWALFKRAKENDTINGYKIPKNTLVVISQQIMHRHKKHWNNPDEFDPNRFVELETNGSTVNPWVYFPFGRGRFSCIAKNFAWAEIYTVVSLILQNFTVSPINDDDIPFEPLATVLVPSGPIRLRFAKR